MDKREQLIEKQMKYYWDKLNNVDDLWEYCQELINVIETEKRENLWRWNKEHKNNG